MAENYIYPYENRDDYKAFIRFATLEYNTELFQTTSSGPELGEVTSDAQAALSRLSSLRPNSENLQETGDNVRLYMPPSIQVSDGIELDNIDLGFVRSAMAEAAQDEDFATAMRVGMDAAITDPSEFRNAISNIVSGNFSDQAARVAATRVASRFGDKTEGFVRSLTKTAMNPNTRALFKSVNLREFSFSFKLMPRSLREAEEIESIIEFFRYHLYPGIITGDESFSIAYSFPLLFRIVFLYDGQPMENVPKILQEGCFLSAVSTNYNPSAMALFRDGKFQEIDLNLTFVETRPLNKTDIRAASTEDDQ